MPKTPSIPKIREVMQMVEDDCHDDVLNPKPFTALGVGETFGETLAICAALARAVNDLAAIVAQLAESHGL